MNAPRHEDARRSPYIVAAALAALALAALGSTHTPPGATMNAAPTTAIGAPLSTLGPNPYDIATPVSQLDTADPSTQEDGPLTDSSGVPRAERYGMTEEATPGFKISNAPGIVLINTASDLGKGAGTGMILDQSGYVLTNYHVVEGSSTIKVTVADTGRAFAAELVGRDRTQDVALLKLQDASGLQPISVSQAAAALGDTVYAVGNGNGQGFASRLDGKVTGVNDSIDVSDMSFTATDRLSGLLRTDADLIPGYSGGPLLNAKGQVIGINTAASTGPSIDGYARPIKDVEKVIEQIRSGSETDQVRIGPKGVLGVQITSEPNVSGAVVADVTADGPAAQAGIKPGDVITEINGVTVTSGSALASRVSELDPGAGVDVTWAERTGETHTDRLELGTSPYN